MAIPNKNVLGNPNVTEGDFQIALESLRESVVGSGKPYDSANTYSQYDTCVSGGVEYYSKVNGNIGNAPAINSFWGLQSDISAGTKAPINNPVFTGAVLVSGTAMGFATGAGGTATQTPNKAANITINKPTCQITMSNSTLLAGETVYFSVFNSFISLNEHVTLTPVESVSNSQNYELNKFVVVNGAVGVKLKNISSIPLSESYKFNLLVTKGATA